MGRPVLSSEVDDVERVIRHRNAICSELLLRALITHHARPEPGPDLQPEPEPELEMIPEPLTAATVADLPIVVIHLNKVEQIKRIICRRFGITKADIEGPCKQAKFAFPRQIGMHLARKHTPYSTLEIARRYGGRDHTTVLWAFKKIQKVADGDDVFASQLAEISGEIISL